MAKNIMNKPAYVPLICSACDLKFGVRKKDYDKTHAYNCPMCLSPSIVRPEDLNLAKKVGRPRKVPPYVFNPTIEKD